MGKTIFGREPAAVAATLEAAIALTSVLLLHWSTDQVGAVMAVITALFGLYTAWATKDTLLGLVIGLVKALLTVAVAFGLHPDPSVTAALIAFITVSAGLFNRTQTSPVGSVVPTPVAVVNPPNPAVPDAPVSTDPTAPLVPQPAPVTPAATPLASTTPVVTNPSPEGPGV